MAPNSADQPGTVPADRLDTADGDGLRPALQPGSARPGALRLDPASGLPLPDPFPDYIACPRCGEAEVEVWCYQTEVTCHRCGQVIAHTPPPWCGTFPFCKRGQNEEPAREPDEGQASQPGDEG